MRRALALLGVALLAGGCGSIHSGGGERRLQERLQASLRPIGRGPRFQPAAGNGILGACRAPLGRRLLAHVEIFAANRVVLLATGIGTRAPRRISDGRLRRANCFGSAVTLDPTGTVYFRSGDEITVGDIFRAWDQPLGARRIASFTGGRVRVYVNGRRAGGAPATVRLAPGAEIVLEIGARVPPHSHFTFGPAPAADLA